MRSRHIEALLRLEIMRLRSLLLRMYLAAGGLLLLFAIVGKASPENVLAVIMGVTAATVLAVPLTVSRDKLEHTLEFLQSLPATVGELVVARFAAGALAVLPGVVATGFALLVLPLPPELRFLAGLSAIHIAGSFWILLTLTTWGLVAATAVFDLATLMSWPLIILVLLALALPPLFRWWAPDDPVAAWTWFATQSWAGVALVVLSGLGTALAAGAAFVVAHRGFASYTPQPERAL